MAKTDLEKMEEYIKNAELGPRQWPEHRFHLNFFGKPDLESARKIAKQLKINFDEKKAEEITKKNIEQAKKRVYHWIKSTYFLVDEINGFENSKKNALKKYNQRTSSLKACINELRGEGVEISEFKNLLDILDKNTLQLSNSQPNKNYAGRIINGVIIGGLVGLLSFGIGYSISKNQLEKKLGHYEQVFQERNQNAFEAYVNDSLLEQGYSGKKE